MRLSIYDRSMVRSSLPAALSNYSHMCTHNVCAQVNEQDGDGTNRQWDVSNDVYQEWAELSDVLGQGVANGLLNIVKD